MKKIVRLMAGTICALLLAFAVQAKPVLLDQVAAVVNQGVVLQSEVQELVAQIKRNAKQANQPLPDDKVLEKQALDHLIQQALQLQVAKKQGLQVSDEQLEQAISSVASSRKMSVTALKADLKKQGVSYGEFRQQVQNEILIGEIQRIMVQRRINISDSEVTQLMKNLQTKGKAQEQYQIGHIEIAIPDNATKAQQKVARSKADRLIRELKNGANFYKLAISESDGPKALQGGNWGWMTTQEMPTLFEEAIKGAQKGDVIGPLRTSNGLHIVKVLGIRGQNRVMETEVKAQQILLKPSVIMSSAKAKQILTDVRQEILSGKASFAEMAKKYSQDPGSAAQGGELDWANPDIYVPAFKEMILRLKPGELSQPFKSSLGWHLVKLQQRKKVDVTGKANRQRAYQLLFRRQFSEAVQNWIDELQGSAYIRIQKTNQVED
ncbi:peptidylprolyl isomerase SurA [Dongshaea marina]|uniref:peptidylprolyl isomerase SurA n=1 Tax=Dongshaea marina TaxID=2047966 RepID=UPI000D3E3D01|nr:peptidylprolyl isomerase SurA [Dongshaea marina]